MTTELWIPLLAALLAGGVTGVVLWVLMRRPDPDDGGVDPSAWVADVVDALQADQAGRHQAALDATLSVASTTLGDQLQAGAQVLERERSAVGTEVAQLRGELARVTALVGDLQRERAEQHGRLVTGLEQALAATTTLADTTQSLRQALASPKARGQWGERMADDVLRLAGFVDGVNYRRQTKTAGGGVPDYSFPLPKGRSVHMDVKFPVDNYLRFLDADTDPERDGYVKAFRRDVRQRIKELGDRGYIDPDSTVDYLLLFIPNESVYGFCHEHDPELLDVALGQKVVLCSPTTLFAVLAVIRQAADNFAVEQRSGEILAAMAGLRDQWDRFGDSVDKVGRSLGTAQKAFDELSGTRRRQFERQLDKLEDLRDQRASIPAAPGVDERGDGPDQQALLRSVV